MSIADFHEQQSSSDVGPSEDQPKLRRSRFVPMLLLAALSITACKKEIDPSRAELDFGTVLVGTTTDPMKATWTNKTGVQVRVEKIKVPDNTPDCLTFGFTWSAQNLGKGDINVPIKFAPVKEKEYSCSVTPQGDEVTRKGANGKVEIVVHGLGGKPVRLKGKGVAQLQAGGLSISAGGAGHLKVGEALDFGAVPVGKVVTRTFRIENTGSNPAILTVGWGQGNQSQFSIANPGIDAAHPPEVKAGSALDLVIRFAPKKEGEFLDAIILTSGAKRIVATALKGKGTKQQD